MRRQLTHICRTTVSLVVGMGVEATRKEQERGNKEKGKLWAGLLPGGKGLVTVSVNILSSYMSCLVQFLVIHQGCTLQGMLMMDNGFHCFLPWTWDCPISTWKSPKQTPCDTTGCHIVISLKAHDNMSPVMRIMQGPADHSINSIN